MIHRVTDQFVLWPDGSTSLPPIDLVNGPDPDPQVTIEEIAPGFSRITTRPRLPFRIGHVLGTVLDPGMVIATDGQVHDAGNADAVFVNAECGDCDSALVVLPNNEPGRIWYVIEHRRSCPAMKQWIKDQRR